MRSRSFILFLIAFLLPLFVLAQPTFTTITDELTIRLNGILQVQYVIENAGRIESFQPPDFQDFRVMQGPMETTGMSMVNNHLTEYKALTYVLQPLHKGKLVVPGAIAIVDGKKMNSNKVIVEVGDAATTPGNPYPRNPGISSLQESAEEDFLLGENENADEKIKNNLLVKLDLDKTSAFIGEPIVATYKLYTRLRSESRVSKRPSMNGFSVYDMLEQYGGDPVVEKINGKSFMMHTIRKTQLIPLQEGKFVLDPVELENTVRFLRSSQKRSNPTGRSPLEKMFEELLNEPSGDWEDHRVTLSSQPRTIEIKALPEGAPASFNGAVGKFSIQGSMKDSTVATGENATYELRVTGSGNLPLVNAPDWNLPSGFDNFEPVIGEDINKKIAPMQGSKTFTYTFSIGIPGVYTLPPVEFSYFDPVTKSYVSDRTKAVTLTVIQGASHNTGVDLPKPATGEQKNSSILLWIISSVVLLTICSLIILYLKRKKRVTRKQKVKVVPVIEPVPVIKEDPFAAAKNATEKNQSTEFYKAVDLGLWLVITDKLGLARNERNKQRAIEQLALKGLSQEDIQLLKDCWKQCEWALYVPVEDNPVQPGLLQNAEKIAMAIDQLA